MGILSQDSQGTKQQQKGSGAALGKQASWVGWPVMLACFTGSRSHPHGKRNTIKAWGLAAGTSCALPGWGMHSVD